MPFTALRPILERAAVDAAFRAKLLANPALAEGLSREQIKQLLDEMALLDGQLTDEMLELTVGGGSTFADARRDLHPIGEAGGCGNHNESGLRVQPRQR